MPATSQKQFRAMMAAAHGKSTLGISAKVGKEFVSGQSPKGLPEHAPKSHSHSAHTDRRSKLHQRVTAGLKRAFPK